jgi:hypothetical protein
VFTLLPVACGLQPITPEADLEKAHPRKFADRLAAVLHEIRSAYGKLLERLGNAICAAFDGARVLAEERTTIRERAAQLVQVVTEPSLRAFAVRLADATLDDHAWIESVANLLTRKSPARWGDADETEFNHQLELAAGRFRRVEAVLLMGTKRALNDHACRISITKTDGTEVHDFVRWDKTADETLETIEAELGEIISRHGRRGLAAVLKVLWKRLDKSTVNN